MIFEILSIAQYELLAEDGDLEDVGKVDDVAFSDSCERGAPVFKILFDFSLHLCQIHAHGGFHLVVQDDVRIVSVRFEVDDLADVQSEKLITRIQIQVFPFVHWPSG